MPAVSPANGGTLEWAEQGRGVIPVFELNDSHAK